MEIKWRFNSSSAKEVLDKLIEVLVLAIVFVVPIWFSYFFPTYNIFELNKTVLLRILLSLMFMVSILKLLFFPLKINYPLGKFFIKYFLPPLVFITGWSVITLMADDPVLAFYGLVERQQGLISYLFYFLWFILLSTHLLDDPQRHKLYRLLVGAVLSASVVAVYAILQILNIDFLTWPHEAYLTLRAFSTLGQPNFLASWLLLVMPLSLYLLHYSRQTWLKIFYSFIFLLQLLALLVSGSRGALVALILTMCAGGAYYLFKINWQRWKKLFLATFIFLFVVILILGFDRLSDGRISELSRLNYGSSGARMNLYQAAWSAWPERFWLGHGLENAENIFIRYYAPDWGIYGNVSQSADRAHNLILDILLAGGVLGLCLWVVLIFYFFRLACANQKTGSPVQLRYFLAWGAAAYLVSLLFSFSFVSGELYFWTFMAILVAESIRFNKTLLEHLTINNYLHSDKGSFIWCGFSSWKYNNLFKILLLIIILIPLVLLLGRPIEKEVRVLAADYYFRKIHTALSEKEYFTALVLDEYLREQKTNPINQESYNIFLAESLSNVYPAIEELATRQAVAGKLINLDVNLSFRTYLHILAKVKISRSLGYLEQAEERLDLLAEIAPGWPTLYYERAVTAEARGDLSEAQAQYLLFLKTLPAFDDQRLNREHYWDVAGNYYRAYLRLASIRAELGDQEEAAHYYKLAYRSVPTDFTLLKKIADTYYLRGNFQEAIRYNLHGLARSPGDASWYIALGILYYESGNEEEGRFYLLQARELDPGNESLPVLDSLYSF